MHDNFVCESDYIKKCQQIDVFFGKSCYRSIHGFRRVTVNRLLCARAAKDNTIACMAAAASASYAKSDKHQKNLVGQQMMTLKDFGISSTFVVQETAAAADIKSVPLVAGTVNNLVNRNQAIMKAEILWTLKTVTSH